MILIDSREQHPYLFDNKDLNTQVAALPIGDYSIQGFQDRVAVERKTLDDLVGCLVGKNRDRFERELQKGRYLDLFVVVVEASMNDIRSGAYRSDMKPHAVLQSIIAFQIRYGTSFIFAGSRAGGEYITLSLLQKYLYEIEKRYQQAQAGNL
jgi:DNA excision repair protein ERCC-4